MPPLAPASNHPYDTVEYILNLSRVRLNDAIVSIGGEVITDNAPFTQVGANGAWRRTQDALANMGASRMTREADIYGIPKTSTLDPGASVYIDWDQFFDGQFTFTQPTLPVEFISPLKVWERPSAVAGTPQNNFLVMDRMINGIPSVAKQLRNYRWEWRADALYMPGATGLTDLRIRFESYLPDFTTIGDTPWYQMKVPIARVSDCLSWFICAEFSSARGDLDTQTFVSNGQAAAAVIYNRDVLQPRMIMQAAEFGKMRDRFTPGSPPSLPTGGQ